MDALDNPLFVYSDHDIAAPAYYLIAMAIVSFGAALFVHTDKGAQPV